LLKKALAFRVGANITRRWNAEINAERAIALLGTWRTMMNNNRKQRRFVFRNLQAFKIMCVLVSLVFTLSSFMCVSYAWAVSGNAYSSLPGYGELRIYSNAIRQDGSELTDEQLGEKFQFAVCLPASPSISVDYAIVSEETGTVASTGKAAADGTFSIELKRGEFAVLLAPVGAPYRISEKHISGTVVLSESSQGNVLASGIDVVFKNAYVESSEGSLEICKLATKSAPLFEFRVKFLFHGEPYTDPVEMSGPGGEVFFSSGDTVGLSSTQSVVFKGLPVGAAYIVEEVDYSNIWYDSNKRVIEGVIIPDLADGTPGVRLDIFNELASKHGFLSFLPITKIVNEHKDQPFVFNVSFEESPYSSKIPSVPGDSTTGPALIITEVTEVTSGAGLETWPPGFLVNRDVINEALANVYISDEELDAVTNELGVINYNNLPEDKIIGIATMGYRVVFKGPHSEFDTWEKDGDNLKISLWPGDIATIANVDTGSRYVISEEPDPNFSGAIQKIAGSIQLKPIILEFSNHWKPLVPIVVKKITENAPPEDKDKEFKIRLLVEGEEVAVYYLKNGEESQPYFAPQEAIFEIIEEDYGPDGYTSRANGYGVTGSERVEIVTSSEYTASAPNAVPTDAPSQGSSGTETKTPTNTPTITPTKAPTSAPAPIPGFIEEPATPPPTMANSLPTSPGSTPTPVAPPPVEDPPADAPPADAPSPLEDIPPAEAPGGPVATPELRSGGEAAPVTSMESPPNPKTADDAQIQLWFFLLVASAGALLMLWGRKPVPQERR
jgi:hypothetical protein